jgi:hypothetical protein
LDKKAATAAQLAAKLACGIACIYQSNHEEGVSMASGAESGFAGQEQRLGQAVALAIRTLKDAMPYQHEMNDALVKMHLNSVQFAKNQGLSERYVAHDVALARPMLEAARAQHAGSGSRDWALEVVFEKMPQLYQLLLDVEQIPQGRRFSFPFSRVLEVSRRIGQFDLTEEEVHRTWLKPRLLTYAEILGVSFQVSDIGADGKVEVRVV